MINKLSYAVIFFGVFIFIFRAMGGVDYAIYYYSRIVEGDTIMVNNQCYSIPDTWVIDSVEARNDIIISNLRKKEGDEYLYISVFNGQHASIEIARNKLIPINKNTDSFSIYELSALSKDNPVRYWSFVQKYNITILGDRADVLELFSHSIQPSACK